MAVPNSQLADLITLTLPNLPKNEFEVEWTNQDYEACRIYQKERMVIDGGKHIERKVMLNHTGNARYRQPYDTDEPAVGDTMHTITVPWTTLGTNYSWDRHEILANKADPEGFIKLMKERRIDGLWALADLIEERFWKTPTNATDALYPYGVPYYINMLNAGATTAGFNGYTIRYQDGTTGTICAGIDGNTEERWRNHADIYTAFNNDLLKKARKAFIYTQFKAPLILNDPSGKHPGAKRWYCGFEEAVSLADLADKRDDRITGKELLGNIRVDDSGLVTINRLPVVPIPQLNGETYSPLYCVDFSQFIPVVLADGWMEETEAMNDRTQHTVFTVFLDGRHNNLVKSKRRAGFVLHKAIPGE
jgi:hypothetical protein